MRRRAKRYFARACATCHSVTGDLKGIGAKFPDARALQNAWVAGSSAPSAAGGGGRGGGGAGNPATVTMADGSKVRRHAGAQRRLPRHPDAARRHAQVDRAQRRRPAESTSRIRRTRTRRWCSSSTIRTTRRCTTSRRISGRPSSKARGQRPHEETAVRRIVPARGPGAAASRSRAARPGSTASASPGHPDWKGQTIQTVAGQPRRTSAVSIRPTS